MFKEINILRQFFEYPSTEFNIREIARILNIAPATASKELSKLAEKGILIERMYKNLKLYKANLEDDYFTDLKIFYNIRKIKDLKLIEELNKFYLKPTIILFGSASQGLDAEDSDFDILIISENQKIIDLNAFERKLNRRLQLFVVNQLKDINNNHLINSILNGIVIQGELIWN